MQSNLEMLQTIRRYAGRKLYCVFVIEIISFSVCVMILYINEHYEQMIE